MNDLEVKIKARCHYLHILECYFCWLYQFKVTLLVRSMRVLNIWSDSRENFDETSLLPYTLVGLHLIGGRWLSMNNKKITCVINHKSHVGIVGFVMVYCNFKVYSLHTRRLLLVKIIWSNKEQWHISLIDFTKNGLRHVYRWLKRL